MEENAAEPNLSSILDAFYNQMNRLREVALRKRPLLINNLEESWCNAKPLEVSSAGQQKPSPVKQRHYKTVVERFPHGVFVSAVQHGIWFCIKRQAPAYVDAKSNRNCQG